MARPTLIINDIDPLVRGWDGLVAQNFENIKLAYETVPVPHCLVYKTTPLTGAVDIATLNPADYFGCTVFVTDPAVEATTGHLAESNGTNWRYVRNGAIV